MREDSGAECWQDGAVEHGRWQRDVGWEKEGCGDSTEETGSKDLFCGKA